MQIALTSLHNYGVGLRFVCVGWIGFFPLLESSSGDRRQGGFNTHTLRSSLVRQLR
jgi:hypothetical protein